MLDIRLIREQPELVRDVMKKRFMDPSLVDKLLSLDQKFRKHKQEVDKLRHERNLISQDVRKIIKKDKAKAEKLIAKSKQLDKKLEKLEQELQKEETEIRKFLLSIPNLLLDDVPIARDEQGNVVVRKWGKPIKRKVMNHVELGKNLDLIDVERAAKVAGARFYYLKNQLVLLDLALQRFALCS